MTHYNKHANTIRNFVCIQSSIHNTIYCQINKMGYTAKYMYSFDKKCIKIQYPFQENNGKTSVDTFTENKIIVLLSCFNYCPSSFPRSKFHFLSSLSVNRHSFFCSS